MENVKNKKNPNYHITAKPFPTNELKFGIQSINSINKLPSFNFLSSDSSLAKCF